MKKKIVSLFVVMTMLVSSFSMVTFASGNPSKVEPVIVISLTEEGKTLPNDAILKVTKNGVVIHKNDLNRDGTLKTKKLKEYLESEELSDSGTIVSNKDFANSLSTRSVNGFESVTLKKYTNVSHFQQERHYSYMSSSKTALAASSYFKVAQGQGSTGSALLMGIVGMLLGSNPVGAVVLVAASVVSAMSSDEALRVGNSLLDLSNSNKKALLYIESNKYFNQTIVSEWNGSTIDWSYNNQFEVLYDAEWFND